MSATTIHRALKTLNITRKVLTCIPAKGDPQRQSAFVSMLDPKQHYVAIDEAAIVMPFAPKYGYAVRHRRALLVADRLPRTRLSLIAAVSSRHAAPIYRLLTRNVDTNVVHSFVQDLPLDWKTATIIADNASYHRKLSQICDVLYLPPYSPQLNPTEFFFQTFKAQLRKHSVRTARSVAMSLRQVAGKTRGPRLFRHCYDSLQNVSNFPRPGSCLSAASSTLLMKTFESS